MFERGICDEIFGSYGKPIDEPSKAGKSHHPPLPFMVEISLFIIFFVVLGDIFQGEWHTLGDVLLPFRRWAGALPERGNCIRDALPSRRGCVVALFP